MTFHQPLLQTRQVQLYNKEGRTRKQTNKNNPKTQAHIWVRGVQLGEAGSLQKFLPLRYRLRTGGFHSWRCGSIDQRQRAGCPPAHVRTKLICTEPHRRRSFRCGEETQSGWIPNPLLLGSPCILPGLTLLVISFRKQRLNNSCLRQEEGCSESCCRGLSFEIHLRGWEAGCSEGVKGTGQRYI